MRKTKIVATIGPSSENAGMIEKLVQAGMDVARLNFSHSTQDTHREVLEHLARGESYAATAKALFLSVDGVRYHIRHIYEKLHVHSRSEAVAKGLKHSLIKPPW